MTKFLLILMLAGGLGFVGAILVTLYMKPKMRRRYERELQRKKHHRHR